VADGRKTYAQRLVQQSTGREVDELLRELYVERRLSDQEISAVIGVPRATIAAWRQDFGITRSDRVPPVLTAEPS
jgi:transposase-like protein